MRRMLLGILFALTAVAPLTAAEQRRNLSIEDVISGFEQNKLFYFKLLLQNGKYTKGFNRNRHARAHDHSIMIPHRRPWFLVTVELRR